MNFKRKSLCLTSENRKGRQSIDFNRLNYPFFQRWVVQARNHRSNIQNILTAKEYFSKLFKKLYAFLHLISKTNIGLYNVVRDCSGLPLYLNHLIKQRYLYYLIIPHILFNFFLLFLLLKVNVKALSC